MTPRNRIPVALLILVVALTTLAALPFVSAQDSQPDASVDGQTLTHNRYGFRISVPDDWTVKGGEEAQRTAAGAEAIFARSDNMARGHMEVMWNGTITPTKYMEQLHEVYGQNNTRVSSNQGLRLKVGGAVCNRYRFDTANGPGAMWVIATGFKEWKTGFVFACLEADFNKRKTEFTTIMNSLAFTTSRRRPEPIPHELAAAGITFTTPDRLWSVGEGSYWPGNRPAGVVASVTRDPYAAYSLIGVRDGEADDPGSVAQEIATEIAQLNQNDNDLTVRGRAKRAKVGRIRAAQFSYNHRSSFPYTTYLVTVFNLNGKTIWVAQWSLPDNFKALEKDMQHILQSIEPLSSDGDDD